MYNILSPEWFLNFDIGIEAFNFIILTLFFIFSLKSYKLTKNKKSLYLGIGFLLIALAEIAAMLTKFVLFYDTTFTQNIGQMIVTYHVVKSINIFYDIGFFLYKLLTLAGLYIIYKFPIKEISKRDIILSTFFLIVSALAGEMIYFIFHLAVIILLIYIIQNFEGVYKNNKSYNTKILISALKLLLISHALFIFSNIKLVYVLGQMMQLISYITLLSLIINIFYNDKSRRK